MYKYEKSTWINGETILKAEHMQKIEQGIVDLQEELENVKVGDIDLSDYYTKTQTDDAMNTKADKVNTYTKAETDNKISEEIAKAQFGGNDKVDLSNYATKNYVDDEISKIGLKEGQIFASDFGVKADGVTDDTEALQLAIDKAKELTVANNSKITVILPKGTIVISNANAQYKDYQPLGIIKVYSNISLEGQGIRETVIRKPTSERELNGITMIYNEGCKDGKEYSEKNIAFKDFTITEGEAEPVHTNGSLITIGHCENLVFERVEGLNFDQHLGDILSCKNIHIKECRINNMSPSQKAASFQFDSRSTALNYNDDETITKDIFVYNNIFEHTNTPTGHLHFHICKEFENVNIYNNYFAGSGIVVDNKLEVRHITIDNNVFINADISAVGLMGANINNNSFDNGGISIGGTEKYNGNPVINDNIKINGNSFKGSVCCINVSSCDKVTVQGNVAENCGNFLASDANEIKVISNDIEVGEQVFLSSKSAIELNSRVDFIGNIIKIKGKNLSNLTKAFYSISLKYYFRCNISNNAITLFNEEYAHKISLFEGFETSHISINSNNIYMGYAEGAVKPRFGYLETYGAFVQNDIYPTINIIGNEINGDYEGFSYASSKSEFSERLGGSCVNNIGEVFFNINCVSIGRNGKDKFLDFGNLGYDGNPYILQINKNTRYTVPSIPKGSRIIFNSDPITNNKSNNKKLIETVDASNLGSACIFAEGTYVWTGNLGLGYNIPHGTKKGVLVETGYISILTQEV